MEAAATRLREGELVAFPTETVYGLGARADRSDAVLRIYAAKGRPLENPSIVHVRDLERALAMVLPDARFAAVGARFWPGPLTLIARPRAGVVAPEVMAGGTTVAIRVPRHPGAQRLLAAVDLPIAAPSANRSNAISPTTAAHVEKSLGDRVALILDGGPTGFGIESTIVDLTSAVPRVLRRGSISIEALGEVLPGVVDRGDNVEARPIAPGNFARHYAPDKPLEIVPRASLADAIARAHADGKRSGVLTVGEARVDATHAIALPDDSAAYAAGFYAALHALDETDADVLFVERLPEDPAWDALRDRLGRAAHRAG